MLLTFTIRDRGCKWSDLSASVSARIVSYVTVGSCKNMWAMCSFSALSCYPGDEAVDLLCFVCQAIVVLLFLDCTVFKFVLRLYRVQDCF